MQLFHSLSAGKGRRQPKPVKPKKMIKMDGQFVVSSGCNNGTSALVTRDGELYMFGKDTSHCDATTGSKKNSQIRYPLMSSKRAQHGGAGMMTSSMPHLPTTHSIDFKEGVRFRD
ncbi:E3 ubiquitin-protein ligase highwire [Portunus trituberculatus]|uniref:E3 ubiquitin-protein ligase highwire n=1 Tax=Portunus trituberculatus TaxID=210409 RepID=A0A5B7H7Z3_PORTR|nr:E3 ubiquitin-protein ligase highwire [Portunus trituberculatus]